MIYFFYIILYFFYIILGLLPSFIWLCFYLSKDKHPEPKSMVLKIFIWGILIAPLAVLLELFLIWLIQPSVHPLEILTASWTDYPIWKIILASTLIPASVEEYLKYNVVKFKVLKSSDFDEPVDAMIYCIIAALGFAAVENLLIVIKELSFTQSFLRIFLKMLVRFLGATFVHALASGIVGYYLAKGLLNPKNRKKLIFLGLVLAIIFHACYNFLIIITPKKAPQKTLIPLIGLLISTAYLVGLGFKKLKKQLSICQI